MLDDDKIWSYEFEKPKGIKPGQLLLSEPFMLDENFRRTVVLVCEHTEDSGTVGLIVNRPVNLKFNEVVEDFPKFNSKLFLGGPVGTDTLQFIHRLGNKVEDSLQLTEELFWGGNFEQVKTMIANEEIGPDDIRFYLGYSGWSPGQINQELKDNSWIITPANYNRIFKIPIADLWRAVMKEMGGVYDTMAGYPENPTLN